MVSTACLALSHLLDKNNEHESIQRIQAVVDAGVVPRVVELLGSRDNSCVVRVDHAPFSLSSFRPLSSVALLVV